MVRHDEPSILHDSNCASSHHRPRVKYSLSSSHLRSGLFRRLREALNHEGGRHIFLIFVHIGGYSQNHEDLLDVGDAHGVEIGKSVAEGYSSEHVGRLDERVEEIESRDESVRVDANGRYVGGFNAHGFWQLGQVRKKLVLGDFAPSSLHLCEICQHEVGVQTVLDRLKRFHRRRFAV